MFTVNEPYTAVTAGGLYGRLAWRAVIDDNHFKVSVSVKLMHSRTHRPFKESVNFSIRLRIVIWNDDRYHYCQYFLMPSIPLVSDGPSKMEHKVLIFDFSGSPAFRTAADEGLSLERRFAALLMYRLSVP